MTTKERERLLNLQICLWSIGTLIMIVSSAFWLMVAVYDLVYSVPIEKFVIFMFVFSILGSLFYFIKTKHMIEAAD